MVLICLVLDAPAAAAAEVEVVLTDALVVEFVTDLIVHVAVYCLEIEMVEMAELMIATDGMIGLVDFAALVSLSPTNYFAAEAAAAAAEVCSSFPDTSSSGEHPLPPASSPHLLDLPGWDYTNAYGGCCCSSILPWVIYSSWNSPSLHLRC